jgi:hypothetical protein
VASRLTLSLGQADPCRTVKNCSLDATNVGLPGGSHRKPATATLLLTVIKVLQEGVTMRRGILLLSTVLIALAAVPAAIASKPPWVPYRDIIQTHEDHTILWQCAFPVLFHVEGPEIQTTFFDRAGSPIRLLGVFPGETITLTNLDTGQSLTVGGTGSFQLRVEPDGSGSAMATGLGVWHDGNPVTGEQGLWYQSGRVSTTWDAEGNTTSLRSTGTLVNLCAELGS